MTVPDAQAIADIDRSLNRGGLTALGRAQLIVKRKEIYDRLHPAGGHSEPPQPRPTPEEDD